MLLSPILNTYNVSFSKSKGGKLIDSKKTLLLQILLKDSDKKPMKYKRLKASNLKMIGPKL